MNYVCIVPSRTLLSFFFFFNDTATTEIYTLSLHDALPIYLRFNRHWRLPAKRRPPPETPQTPQTPDRKSTRLNSSHDQISYAVFCLKKKTNHAPGSVTNPQVPGLAHLTPQGPRLSAHV